MIIVKFPKVRSTQFELVTNCHRLTLKLVRGLKKVYFLQSFPCLVIFLVVFLSLYRSQKLIRPAEAYIYGFLLLNLFDSNLDCPIGDWKMFGNIKCRGKDYSACTPRAGQVSGT